MTSGQRWAAIAIVGAAAAMASIRFAPAAERPDDPGLAARYDAAMASYDARRFDEARREFEALAGEGVAQAEFMLGVMHEYGDGVGASYGDAVRWYEAAADRGLTSAETRLGLLCMDGTGMPPDPRRARQWLERAARKRDPLALLTLGDMSARGQGAPQSLEDAYAYYLLAKDAGSPKADAAIADLTDTLSAGRREEAARRAAMIDAGWRKRLAEDAAPEHDAAVSSRATTVARLQLSPFSVRDDGLGGVALHLLAPRDWKLQGGIVWRADSASPADLDVRVASADGNLAYTVLPRRGYVWRSQGGTDKTRPFIGPRGYESRPPVGDAVVFIEKVVLPERHRPGSYEIIDRRPLPSVARVVASGADARGSSDVSAARVRLRARGNAGTFDEDVYCVLVQTRTPAGGEELVFWGPERLYAFRAPAGRLDEHHGVLQSIASSMRFDDAWLGRYSMLRADIRDRPGRSRISDREFELFLKSARDSHANARSEIAAEQERLRARVNAALAAELGETETFFDPRSEREVSLPKGFARAWASARGHYLVSADGEYDPRAAAPAEAWAELHAVSAR